MDVMLIDGCSQYGSGGVDIIHNVTHVVAIFIYLLVHGTALVTN